MQILLIESDEGLRQYWLQRLGGYCDDVGTAVHFAEASALLNARTYDGVFCQWEHAFAKADGLTSQAMQQIKARAQLAVCIAAAEPSIDQLAYAAGFDEVLHHRCGEEQLAAKLAHAARLAETAIRLAQAQKLESIGELAAGIAHEINTPIQYVGDNTRFVQDACSDLTAVLACCQQLIATAQSAGDVSSATEQLRASMEAADVGYLMGEIPAAIEQTLEGVDRVTNIVRAMKEFTHPGGAGMTLTDMGNAITNTVMVARNEWKYVADIETDLDPDLPLVPCLPGELNQVLLNIIVNAAHAIAASLGDTPTAKGKITISTSLGPPYVEVRISDSGTGIAPENIGRVFNPFFTTKAAGKGTGQGLAIARSVVVEKHNGKLEVESEVGKGTTFVIRLPLEQTSTGVTE